MDVSLVQLGIHGESRAKSDDFSIACHGCPESPILGIHEGIHGRLDRRSFQ
jgi:hypothetical protein